MSESAVHIVEFCAAVDRQHVAQEERLKGDPENPAHDQLDLKPRARDALINYIATRAGVDTAAASEFVYRCAHGAFWGPWRRTNQNWPDFTASASIICAYFNADRMSELQQRFCAEYPEEAREMGMLTRDPAVHADQPQPTHSPITPAGGPAVSSAEAVSLAVLSVDDDSHFSAAKLAEVFGVPRDALRTRLNRWRKTRHDGWIEDPDRGSREPKYLYRVGSVRVIINGLKATSETTSERPAE